MATKILIFSTILLCLIIAQTLDVSAKSQSKSSSSKLTMEKSSEGRCIHPSPKKIDQAWLTKFAFEAKYTPMASELAYLSIARGFGKTLQSWSELKKLCMDTNPQVAKQGSDWTGFGKTVFTKCNVKSAGIMKCSMGGGDLNMIVTWTDFKNYMVVILCQSNVQKSWIVKSTKKKIDSKAKKTILAHIKSLGFDEKKAKTASYDSC